jgi:hypothetical protein
VGASGKNPDLRCLGSHMQRICGQSPRKLLKEAITIFGLCGGQDRLKRNALDSEVLLWRLVRRCTSVPCSTRRYLSICDALKQHIKNGILQSHIITSPALCRHYPRRRLFSGVMSLNSIQHLIPPTNLTPILHSLVLPLLHCCLEHLPLLGATWLPSCLPSALPRLRCLANSRVHIIVGFESIGPILRIRPTSPWRRPDNVRY